MQWLIDYLNEALDSAQWVVALALDGIGLVLAKAGDIRTRLWEAASAAAAPVVGCPDGSDDLP